MEKNGILFSEYFRESEGCKIDYFLGDWMVITSERLVLSTSKTLALESSNSLAFKMAWLLNGKVCLVCLVSISSL
jgi:hypothetical protein